ncbi:MAG: SfiI family type II restriction endonuclease, partial [Chloroflexi bacterium]|nr:SfiI family type II restriction endonuclease [Chloroflexota bacterium]
HSGHPGVSRPGDAPDSGRQHAPRNKSLASISVLCLPSGSLQERYNPTARDSIWLVGRNAPTRGEVFRVRISLPQLRAKARWRVQSITLEPLASFAWEA